MAFPGKAHSAVTALSQAVPLVLAEVLITWESEPRSLLWKHYYKGMKLDVLS